MAIRQAFFKWLIPAAFVLPLWLLVGYFVFRANVWAVLWVLFIAMPAVFVGQLIFSLMIRSRPSVSRSRAVSWLDIAVMGSWHVLTVLVGLYSEWFPLFLTLAIIGAVAVLWSSLWQLWQEASNARVNPMPTMYVDPGAAHTPQQPPMAQDSDVFTVTEKNAR